MSTNSYELSTERETRIAGLCNASVDAVRDVLYYDWPNWEEHIEWLQSASDKEIAGWCMAVGVAQNEEI